AGVGRAADGPGHPEIQFAGRGALGAARMSTMLKRVAAVAGLGMVAAAAWGQDKTGCMERKSPHDWTLSAYVRVKAYPERDPQGHMPAMGKPFDFTSAAVVFPMISDTASSV